MAVSEDFTARGKVEAASEARDSWTKSRRCMCGQWATNLNGDFNTEFTEDTEKTRKKGEQGIIAEGSRDTENAEKKKQTPSDKVGTFGRFGRNDSTMFGITVF